MTSSRLEAFTDGVMAVAITIMVLALQLPDDASFSALLHTTGPMFLTYLLSFIYIGIYWNNHHHMMKLADHITGMTLWANLHLLFWLSLIPFSTAWMDDTHLAPTPIVVYGVNLLGAAIAYFALQSTIIRGQGESSRLRRAIGKDVKGKVSLVLYLTGIGLGLLTSVSHGTTRWPAVACFVVVALLWLIPDVRMEREIIHAESAEG
ncbi:MAG TPA: TMEM175 family protein [Thermomicrobiales bacterium]|nr:TMEM175 family protein [Thermomicrobiales bacterium]